MFLPANIMSLDSTDRSGYYRNFKKSYKKFCCVTFTS